MGKTTATIVLGVFGFASLASVGVAAGSTPLQEPRPVKDGSVSATAEATLIEVPVHVTGRNGAPLRGLGKDDFELFDDGDKVPISEVERVDLEDFSKGLTPRELPLPPAARRHFFLLFDISFSSPVKMALARDAARDFVLNGMKSGDFAGVATYDVERGMKLVLSFTPDRDQVAAAVETLGLPSLTQPTADPLALTVYDAFGSGGAISSTTQVGTNEMAEQLRAMVTASRRSFDSYQRGRVAASIRAMEDLARTLNTVRGRKDIIYLSEGFDSRLLVGQTGAGAGLAEGDQSVSGEIWKIDSDSRFGNTDLKIKLGNMLSLFRRSDCVIHAVDISGLRERAADPQAVVPGDSGPADREGGHGRGQDSLFMLAHETGGEVLKNTNDLSGQLERIQQQTSVVYLLVFAPPKLREPGRYHELKVKVKAPGATISARAGYYEPRPFSKLSPMERRLATAQMLAYGLPRTEVAAHVLAAPFRVAGRDRAEVPVIVEIMGRPFLKDQVGDVAHLELYAYVTDSQLRVRDFFSQTMTLELGKLRGALESGGLKYYGTLALPPGSFWLKVLVRNADTGRTGLQVVPVTVPDTGRPEPFVLTPFFHEAPGRWVMVKGAVRTGSQPYPFVSSGSPYFPAAAPTLETGKDSLVSLVMYNVPEGSPVELEARLKGLDGKDAGEARLVRRGNDEAGPGGSRRLLCSFRPEGVPRGFYSLLVTLRNTANGTEGQSAIPIEIR